MILKRGKRGQEAFWPVLIFILISLIFFTTVFLFVFKSATGAVVYEEIYAKKIALVLDEAKPGMAIYIDLTKAMEVAKKNEIIGSEIKKIIEIDKEKNFVKLKLNPDAEGFVYYYFSEISFDWTIDGTKLRIKVLK